MIKFINSWAQGIILAVIIATIIEIILPEGNNKKYVKTIIGIYILFSIIYPLITKISNKSININSILDITNREISNYENSNNLTIETNAYIEDTYKQKLQVDIKQKIQDKGYNINQLNIYIETEDESRYGQINSIVMKLSKKENLEINKINKNQNITNNNVNQIQEVQINVTNNNSYNTNKNIENEDISIDEIKTLKEYLNISYSIDKEKIHINE